MSNIEKTTIRAKAYTSYQQWPELSALDNAADFFLATLPMALPPKNFSLKLPNSVRNAKKVLEAMPLTMLPIKSLQHWQKQMIQAIVCVYEGGS